MDDSQCQEAPFGKLRNLLWPIYRHELKKLLPMFFIFFLITFNYNILRTMKDTLVVTTNNSGAAVIPFIKLWFMFPGSIVMTLIYTRLNNRFSRETVFYLMVGGFLAFFVLFALLLYPNADQLHFDGLALLLQGVLPVGFGGLISALKNWTFTSFYVMAELWGNIILFVLMWGFTNQVTRITEAKRFYAIFGVGINASGILAGWLSGIISMREGSWENAMDELILLVIGTGLAIVVLFRWLHVAVIKKEFVNGVATTSVRTEKKQKISLREGLSFFTKSRYLLYLAVIVIAYNIVINLVEVVWKQQVRDLYPNKSDFNGYMSNITFVMGVIATFTSLFISGASIRKLGWAFTAMLTPFILFATSVAFFGALYFRYAHPEFLHALTGVGPLSFVVFLGSLQNVLSRAAKYTVFDATKEMAYVPLSDSVKTQGKAVIDGIASRLGKSGGSAIYQLLLLSFSSLTASIPYVAGFLFTAIALWMGATRLLTQEYRTYTRDEEFEGGIARAEA